MVVNSGRIFMNLSKAEAQTLEESAVAFAERGGFEPPLDFFANLDLLPSTNAPKNTLILTQKTTNGGKMVVVSNKKQTGENDEKCI